MLLLVDLDGVVYRGPDPVPGVAEVLARRELRDVGLEVVRSEDAAPRAVQERIDGFEAAGRPDTVVVGLDPGLTYGRIAVAADAIRAGARFVATNRDPVYPTERGLAPGAGSVVAAGEVAAGVARSAVGQPEPRA